MTGRRLTPGRISEAEARILTEIARGGSHAEVAARLHLSHDRVRNAMCDARRRVGATTTVHLLALAITAGDVDPDCADGTAVTL